MSPLSDKSSQSEKSNLRQAPSSCGISNIVELFSKAWNPTLHPANDQMTTITGGESAGEDLPWVWAVTKCVRRDAAEGDVQGKGHQGIEGGG